MNVTDKPCAAHGLTSYRYRGMWGWVMIGAKDHDDALSEARRSVNRAHVVSIDRLQVWDGKEYVPVT